MGKVLQRFKVGKHFQLERRSFNYCRKQEAIEREAALDGIYVIRSSLTQADDGFRSGAILQGSVGGRAAFRSFKTVDLKADRFTTGSKRVRA